MNVVAVIKQKTVRVVSIGRVFIQNNGGGGTTLLTHPAAMDLGGHRIVVLDSDGRAIYADNATIEHASILLGLTTGAASSGSDATIQPFGEIVEPSWSWALNEPVFLGANGLLTQVVPEPGDSAAFQVIVGFPLSATSLFIRIDEPILL